MRVLLHTRPPKQPLEDAIHVVLEHVQVATYGFSHPDAQVGARLYRWGFKVWLTPYEARMALPLLASIGAPVLHTVLFDQMYDDREDGGPLDDNTRSQFVLRLRKKLAPIGLALDRWWGMGMVLKDVEQFTYEVRGTGGRKPYKHKRAA